jgi:predicted dehydrogenase
VARIRFGIIGAGFMGSVHARNMLSKPSREYALVAVSDTDAARAKALGQEIDVRWFREPGGMIESGLCDAVLIATPHYWHPIYAIMAARAGIHVLCEKPLASAVGPARAMVHECRRRKVVLGAMLQSRIRPPMARAKQLVDGGALGRILSVTMICSNWYRTQAYYDSGSWRGTWEGEGGGVLINQAPHSLDLFQWIGGMPTRVTALLKTRLHRIDVENTAQVICEYADKDKVGYLYATTAEAPGKEELTVAGEKATLVVGGGKLTLGTLAQPMLTHMRTSQERYKGPSCSWRQVKVYDDPMMGHLEVIRRFARHLLHGTPLVATGQEGLNELELSNAVYLAGFGPTGRCDLPVDAAAMDRLLGRLAANHVRKGADNQYAQTRSLLAKLLK